MSDIYSTLSDESDCQIPSGGNAARFNVLPHRIITATIVLLSSADASRGFFSCCLFDRALAKPSVTFRAVIGRQSAHLNRRGMERPMWTRECIGISTMMPAAAASVDRSWPRFREHGVGRHCDLTEDTAASTLSCQGRG